MPPAACPPHLLERFLALQQRFLHLLSPDGPEQTMSVGWAVSAPQYFLDLTSIFRDGPSVSPVGRFGCSGWSWARRWPGCR
ncbi:hypothetical protein ACWFR1_25875, partial [Streptomyces sp. NPDC055103]